MIKNYFKLAWRNLLKNKIFSAINIIGLSVGMAACIVIMLFVSYEENFDAFHKKNIYRLNEVQKFEGMAASQNVALSMFPMGPTLQSEFPEIKNHCRIFIMDKIPFVYKEKKIFVPKFGWADSTFLKMFDFKLARGNRNAFDKWGSIIISQKMATLLFGNEDPIGKTITREWRDSLQFTVTGILENVPENSHLQFDILATLSPKTKKEQMNTWGDNWVVTYLELNENTDIKALEKKFPAYLKDHLGEGQKNYELFLQPLKDVHSASSTITHDYLNFQKFDRRYTSVFSVIAFIVLAIGCVNFMNLSTARSARRAKEVGVRKSTGATRTQLIAQFLYESLLYAFIALLFAVLLVKLFLPFVNNISQRQLEFSLFSNISLLLILIGGTFIVGIISGLYPAFYLSSFIPIKVLKGSATTGSNKSFIRNALVVGQFACAVFFLIATIFVTKQLSFMQTSEQGFNREQVLAIPLHTLKEEKYNELKTELLKNAAITDVAGSTQRLGNNLHQTGALFRGDGPEIEIAPSHVIVDKNYLRLYKISLVAGRDFNSTDNRQAFIVNEMMAKELLKNNPG
ncbi:MAG: ABC transporter permease, partial [Bacteroidia bacterium]|nr:ABC transporter permease [Bacteroidia bacterium]